MKEFLIVHWPSIIVTIFVLGLLAYMWVSGKRDYVKMVIYMLVCQAEQQFGSGTGSVKLALVWANIYERLPLIIRLLFPKSTLEKYIEQGVQRLKRDLENPKFNLMTYAQEVEEVIKGKIN